MINMPEWQRCLDAQFGSPKPGQYRAQPEDFWVDEQLDFTPEAYGEHLWLRVEKRNQTTLDVVNTLSRLCGVTPRDIGYSGMKDRIAVTRQRSLSSRLMRWGSLSLSRRATHVS